ncbi:hypothetical protein QN375_24250 [Pseudomonas sp. MH9.2]|uniref:hypothetical protein n=1 Tax=unclassified Pseudomonas TaxID=196821 RepID=UPI002AC9D455|nr:MULTISPECIES: hypothetical protein [unclassified Pseudomonas]MEB0028844.1 hypothetical protein [Pseudomonas sp. MH9.2]MEE3508343.1 hypothetical protein [Pseudomonas sp. 10C3]WPX71653.1 hypothetical protein RHM55_23065 [Pseudomonas sp. MH9.2]
MSKRETCCTPPDEQKLPNSNCSKLTVPSALVIGSASTFRIIARNAATQIFWWQALLIVAVAIELERSINAVMGRIPSPPKYLS